MKHIGNLLLVVLMLSLIVTAGGCGAKFELSSFEVSPGVCLAGETVTVSATLNYSGSVEGEYEAELLVDEVTEHAQTLTVEPESSQSISFTLTRDEPGTYAVQLGESTASLTVLEVSNFELSPAEVEIDQPVTVSADLRNVAETEVTYNCDLLCRGESVATQDITLAGGATDEVTFTLSQGTPGMYEVQLGDLSGSFKVLKPAEFEVQSFDILPNPVSVGGEAEITPVIKNVGEVEGIYNASLIVDGVVYETMDVTLAGGVTKPVAFSLSKDSPGSYNIETCGQEAVLEVVQPVRLPTGTILRDESFKGSDSITIKNETTSDLVAVLSSTEEPMIPLVAVYVQASDSYTCWEVKAGTYFMSHSFGADWDDNSKKFLTGAIYSRVFEEFVVEGWGTVRQGWIFNFTAEIVVLSIILPLDEDEFPDLK